MSGLALAYLLPRDERYALAAKKIPLECESWGIGGPMPVLRQVIREAWSNGRITEFRHQEALT